MLPALGEDAVEQRAVGELVDGVEPEQRDPPAVGRAEGRPAARRGRSAARPSCGSRRSRRSSSLRLDGSFVSVRVREVRELLAAAREEPGTTAAARERFRMSLLRRFYEEYGRVLGAAAIRNFDEVEQALRANGLPRPRAQGGLAARRSPTGSSARCSRRAPRSPRRPTGILDAGEQKLLLPARRRLVGRRRAAARRGARAARRRRRTPTGT